MSRVRRDHQSHSNDQARLPLRWGVILMAAVGAGAAAFVGGGSLPAIGAVLLVISTLHKVLS